MLKNMGIGFLGSTDLDAAVRNVKLAEELGFAGAWIAEDYFYGGAFTTVATCAAATSKIKLGTGVINPFSRHPVLIAMEAAALDIASHGRLIVGIGTSNLVWMEKKMGIPFQRPLRGLKEGVQILRRLIHGETVTQHGEAFNVTDVHLDLRPCRPDLPIYFGVKGPKALQMAGELGDGILLSLMTSEPYIRYAIEQIRSGRQKVGRDLAGFEVAAYLLISMDDDRRVARERVKPMLAKYLGVHGDHPILRTSGMPLEDIMAFRNAFLTGTNALHLVKDEHIDLFAVAGTPVECREKLSRLIGAGLSHPIAFQISGFPMEQTMRSIVELL